MAQGNPSLSRIYGRVSVLRATALPQIYAAFVALAALFSFAYIYSGCCVPRWLPIRADGFGYYAYLPAVFIDHDLSMKTPLANRRSGEGLDPVFPAWNGISDYKPTGRLLDKYTVGTALLQVPFFVPAHAAARALRLPPYSLPYQIGALISSVTFLLLGTWLLLRRLLRHFSPLSSVLAASAVIFGTSLFHNAVFLPSYSHVYSFFLFALLLTLSEAYRAHASRSDVPLVRHCTALGAVLGLIALVRVPNIIGCILPLAMAWERYRKAENLRVLSIETGIGVVAFLAVFSLQIAYWRAVTGHFLVNSYQGEQFNWLEPKVLDFLFSIRRGLFIWSPLTFVAILGLPLLIRRDRWLGIAISIVLALEIYICSSWWSWWFGSTFGSRPISDLVPLFGLPFAAVLDWSGNRIWRVSSIVIIAGLVSLNMFLMLSFWNELFPWNDASAADLERLPSNWENHHFLLPDIRKQLALSGTYSLGSPFRADARAPPGMWLEGFTERRAPASWTVGRVVSLFVHLPPRSPDLGLTLYFAAPGGLLTQEHSIQRGFVVVNGSRVGLIELRYGGDNRARSVLIPRWMLHNQPITRIDFKLPDAIAPLSLGRNSDPRLLAFYVSRITLEQAPFKTMRMR